MRARTYRDADAEPGVLHGKTVAVIGYGNQGHAQAQNLRDTFSGGPRGGAAGGPGHGPGDGAVRVIVGNRDDEYRARAAADGFEVLPIGEAARRADVLLLLIPDEVQPEVMAAEITPGLPGTATLVVASGYNVAFGLLPIPDGIDVVMVAPRMIGVGVRGRFREGRPFPCFVSVERDASGAALRTALAVARGIGATAGGAVASSAMEEAALDLFSEQAIWPSVFALFQAAYEVLSAAGFSDDAILDEMYLSGEPAEIFARASEMGLVGQLPTHSRTSQYGQLTRLARSAGVVATLRERFGAVLRDDILSGAFAREWSSRLPEADDLLRKLSEQASSHPLIAAETEVRGNPPAT